MNTHETFEHIYTQLSGLLQNGPHKITLIQTNGFGFPCLLPVTMFSVEKKGYAQYDDGLEITLKKKGGRTLYKARFYGSETYCGTTFSIFDGWHNSSYEAPKSWMSFDKSMFYGMVDSMGQDSKICEYSERVFAEQRMNRGKVYTVIQAKKNGGGFFSMEFPTVEDLKTAFRSTGNFTSRVTRLELQGAPILDGFCGPMYDGLDSDGNTVIRYESQEVYNVLSC